MSSSIKVQELGYELGDGLGRSSSIEIQSSEAR